MVEGDRILALEAMLDWRWFKPVAWNKLYKRDVLGDIRYPKENYMRTNIQHINIFIMQISWFM